MVDQVLNPILSEFKTMNIRTESSRNPWKERIKSFRAEVVTGKQFQEKKFPSKVQHRVFSYYKLNDTITSQQKSKEFLKTAFPLEPMLQVTHDLTCFLVLGKSCDSQGSSGP